ncbi:metal-dependent hydrolase [Natrinema salaciae]|uniref:LexA-binding, inner membrane-associated putative hydrolase n=1 Tax=Natrinema salaciae TaxID=1186196 RepID=A0A1H9E896_9EURY|nr:metal-dependent hydrolase [Natrinema salaciae]SEQ21911.1 LexA-binding, inner membrane-associated putative hydrolase [Natrinema salaciae]
MWPWEHAIVGYLAYSLFCHLAFRDSPGGLDAFAVVFASVLPDVIDKPLAWEFGVFDAGHALGHSVFFAVPLSIVVGTIAHAGASPRTGLAFGVGYLLHLPADILYSYVNEGVFYVEIVLWPVATVPAGSLNRGFLESFALLFGRYLGELLAGDVSTYVWFQFGLAVFAFLLWVYDGVPVLRELLLGCKRLVLAQIGSDRSTQRQ